MKINLKKKSHVKGYALRGAGLRKQVSFVFASEHAESQVLHFFVV